MKALFIVASVTMLVAAMVADGNAGLLPQEVKALSQNGAHRLCLKSVEQVKSPWDDKIHALTLTFRLEYRHHEYQFVGWRPENVFLEGVEPLDEVILPSGKNVAANKHSAWTDEGSSETVIHTLEVGEEQKHLRKLKLTLTLVKVTEWQQLEFKDLRLGKSETLHCGPFEMDCTGETGRFCVSVGSRSEFGQEHESYRKIMPLRFLSHRYAINHVRITDLKGLTPTSCTKLGTGGSTSGYFSFLKPMNLENNPTNDGTRLKSGEGKAAEPVAYPVTLQLRLPTKYETEHVAFEFENVELPLLEKPRKQ